MTSQVRRLSLCVLVWVAGTVSDSWSAKAGGTNDVASALRVVERQRHWSLAPVVQPEVPVVAADRLIPKNPIDNFVFAVLTQHHLSPSPLAGRRVLIRRLYFDLLGLPPSMAEVAEFEQDTATDAYERLVDRLLASPHYGERWGQHWLDVVRFAETHGFEMNQPRPNAWRYRDYVIAAFNEDKPYDRFVLEQLAGDALGVDAATGFLVAGPWDQVKSPDPVLTATQRADELHDMVSVTGSALLGLTVACARCHDHKFDPIPQTDYYRFKACLADVQHGDRKLRSTDLEEREREAEQARGRLIDLDAQLATFEPMSFPGTVVFLDDQPAETNTFASRALELAKPSAVGAYRAGTARGERDDPGDAQRLPNLTPDFLMWSNVPNADLLAYEPRVQGRFHIWVSWACGGKGPGPEVRYILETSGNTTAQSDRKEIARVDQSKFADGTLATVDHPLWSGFADAKTWDLTPHTKIILRAGPGRSVATADAILLVEEIRDESDVADGSRDSSPSSIASPSRTMDPVSLLRAPVNARQNVERFSPIAADRLRFTVLRTTDAEPCIDELEVYSAGSASTNVALASQGTKAVASSVFPNSDIHRLEHVNDGRVGNRRSWISNERGRGWVQLEFPRTVTIDRVVWGRDREQQYGDRLAVDYRVEVATGSNGWRLVASSRDRQPYVSGRGGAPSAASRHVAGQEAKQVTELLAERAQWSARLKELINVPMVYAGTFSEPPQPIHLLNRGDPMQERDLVDSGALGVIPVEFQLGEVQSEAAEKRSLGSGQSAKSIGQQRRLALARWMVNPANPLTCRVIVNRLWQHHFSEGLVSTPSDFGANGAKPTHPELLDWLAAELVKPSIRDGETDRLPPAWSLKHIHRLIVNSATYRQAGSPRSECLAIDAGSRFLWRFPPHRLEAEPLRDTILSVSGSLDLSMGGPGFSAFEPNDNYVRVYEPKKEFGPPESRRMVYMTKVRMQQDGTFGAFDCPDGGLAAPRRGQSTTPLQALNLLNSSFMMRQVELFAGRLEREAGQGIGDQIRLAFGLAFNRAPDLAEQNRGEELIKSHGLRLFCRAVFNSNEFIFVE